MRCSRWPGCPDCGILRALRARWSLAATVSLAHVCSTSFIGTTFLSFFSILRALRARVEGAAALDSDRDMQHYITTAVAASQTTALLLEAVDTAAATASAAAFVSQVAIWLV